jgi:hypothetical protein
MPLGAEELGVADLGELVVKGFIAMGEGKWRNISGKAK